MKRLGQHFLINRGVLKKIVNAIPEKDIDCIIEIGGGHGELSGEILQERSPKEFIVIEKDRDLVPVLRKNLPLHGVRVIEGDVRSMLPEIVKSRSPHGTYIIVGNIPYYLTGYLFRLIGELEERPVCCIFMIQAEVAGRLAAKAPRMNRLAAMVQHWADVHVLFKVSRDNFQPKPEVESAVVRLSSLASRKNVDDEAYEKAVRTIFAQPRKTILNNLISPRQFDREKTSSLLKILNIDAKSRPGDLTVSDISEIARHLKHH